MMKKYFIITACLLVFISTLRGETYDLDYCIATAIKNNPTLKKHKNNVRQSEYNIKIILTSYFPSIRLSGDVSRRSDYITDSFEPGDTYSFSLSLNQVLFQGMDRWYNYKIGLLGKSVVEETYFNSLRGMIYEIKENYYKILLNKKQAEVLKKTIERRKHDLILIKLKYESGKEKLTSVMEMESDVKTSEYNEGQKIEELKLAKMRLMLLMGRDFNEEFDINIQEDEFREFEFKSVIEKVKSCSPELNTAKMGLKIEEYNLKKTTAEYFPGIDLSASYNRSDEELNDIVSTDRNNRFWRFGLSISLPIFTGFSTSYKRSQVKYKIKSKQEEIKEVENNITTTVFDILSRYSLLKKEQEVVLMKYKSANESYKLINLEYKQGRTSYNWLQQKEIELSRLELEKERIVYNLRVAQAKIMQFIQDKNFQGAEN